jgi:hypothetical protein
MGVMTTVTLVSGKRPVRKSVSLFRFFVTRITLAARFHLEQVFKIGNVGLMTGSALTVPDRLMQKVTFLHLTHKLRVAVTTELTGSLVEQRRIT